MTLVNLDLVRNFFFWCLLALGLLSGPQLQAFNTVVIDAGHGAHDRGASIGYVFEKHLALDTARRVEKLLRSQGIRVVMTRSSDVFLPLASRAAIGNRYGNALFVSVHYNYSKSVGGGSGLETFYTHNHSYPLAAYIQAYIVQETGLHNRGVKFARFHVIRNTTKNPAVLVECGFVSNSSERAAMMSGRYREKMAQGIAKGILAYKRVAR